MGRAFAVDTIGGGALPYTKFGIRAVCLAFCQPALASATFALNRSAALSRLASCTATALSEDTI